MPETIGVLVFVYRLRRNGGERQGKQQRKEKTRGLHNRPSSGEAPLITASAVGQNLYWTNITVANRGVCTSKQTVHRYSCNHHELEDGLFVVFFFFCFLLVCFVGCLFLFFCFFL